MSPNGCRSTWTPRSARSRSLSSVFMGRRWSLCEILISGLRVRLSPGKDSLGLRVVEVVDACGLWGLPLARKSSTEGQHAVDGAGQTGDDPARKRRIYPKGGESTGNMQHGDNVKDCPRPRILPQASKRGRCVIPSGSEVRVEPLSAGMVPSNCDNTAT